MPRRHLRRWSTPRWGPAALSAWGARRRPRVARPGRPSAGAPAIGRALTCAEPTRTESGRGMARWSARVRRSGRRRVVEHDLDERAVADHHFEIVAAPGASDVGQERTTLLLFGDDPRRPGEVGDHVLLQVDRHARVCLDVGEPGALLRAGHPADHYAAIDRVEDDLDPARFALFRPVVVRSMIPPRARAARIA